MLLKHGVFSFGDTAREAYDRMIDIVSQAEERLARGRKSVFAAAQAATARRRAGRGRADPARRLRPARPDYRRAVEALRARFPHGPAVLDFVNGAELVALCARPGSPPPTTRSAPRTTR